jgi:hypothetical protein
MTSFSHLKLQSSSRTAKADGQSLSVLTTLTAKVELKSRTERKLHRT